MLVDNIFQINCSTLNERIGLEYTSKVFDLKLIVDCFQSETFSDSFINCVDVKAPVF